MHGPTTRSRAQQPNHQVNSFLSSYNNDLDKRLLPNDLIVIRNQGVDHGGGMGHQDGAGEPRKQGEETSQYGIPEFHFESNSEFRITSPSN
jgi:hypothetical protein